MVRVCRSQLRLRARESRRAAVPFRREFGPLGRLRPAEEELARHHVAQVGPPLEIGAEDLVVPAAVLVVDVATGVEQARERRPDVVPEASDADERGVVLGNLRRAGRAGDDDETAPAILGGEHGVGRVPDLAGGAPAPARRGDRARVDRGDWRAEEVDALQEERALLRVEERETVVDRDLGHVGFDLREVGVDRGVERGGRARRPLHVQADVQVLVALAEGRARRGGDRDVLAADVGGGHEVARGRQPRDPAELVEVADEAVGAPRMGAAEEAVPEVAGVVPPDAHAPGLGIGSRVAQGRQGDPHLDLPAPLRHPGRGVEVEVGGEVLGSVGVVVDRVSLDAARVHAELEGGAPVVARVEEDRDVVLVSEDGVAVGEGSADLAGRGVVAGDRDVERGLVVHEEGAGLDQGGAVVAERDVVEGGDRDRRPPRRVAQVAVDRGRLRRARQGEGGHHGDGILRPRRGGGRQA